MPSELSKFSQLYNDLQPIQKITYFCHWLNSGCSQQGWNIQTWRLWWQPQWDTSQTSSPTRLDCKVLEDKRKPINPVHIKLAITSLGCLVVVYKSYPSVFKWEGASPALPLNEMRFLYHLLEIVPRGYRKKVGKATSRQTPSVSVELVTKIQNCCYPATEFHLITTF